MSLTNPNKVITEQRLHEFYQGIYPYLNGSAHAGFTPVGTIISVMGNTAPANYLACNGQTVNIADYPELANYFEEQFGTKNHFGGDGTATFGIPDLRGEFLRGTGTNGHSNQGNGANVGEHQDATDFPSGNFNETNLSFNTHANENNNFINNEDRTYSERNWAFRYSTDTSQSAGTSANSRVSIRPTNTSVLYCIATKNIYIDTVSNIKVFTFTIPANSNAATNITVEGITSNMDGILGLNNPTTNQKLVARSCNFNFTLGTDTITVARSYGATNTQAIPCMFICTGETNSGVINAVPQGGRSASRLTIATQNIRLTTTESEITIPDAIANMLSDGSLQCKYMQINLGSGDNGFDSPLLWLMNSVNSATGRRYSHKFYIGQYLIKVGFSEDYKTLYASANTTDTNLEETYFRGIYGIIDY